MGPKQVADGEARIRDKPPSNEYPVA